MPYDGGQGLVVCYNYGGLGHCTRDCMVMHAPPTPEVYANSAKMFDNYYGYYDDYGNGPWYFDSGAFGHIAADMQRLDLQPSSSRSNHGVKTSGGESHPAKGTSSYTLRNTTGEIKLANVYYVPSMKKNLISIGSIVESDHIIVFTASHCYVYDKNQPSKLIATGKRDPTNSLFCF